MYRNNNIVIDLTEDEDDDVMMVVENNHNDIPAVAARGEKNSMVLITGDGKCRDGTNSTEIFDFSTRSFREGPRMQYARYSHASVTLRDGNVVLFGGVYGSAYGESSTFAVKTCEMLNVTTGKFSCIGEMNKERKSATAVLLSNGLVLIFGGYDNKAKHLKCCELFDPATGIFTMCKGKMKQTRTCATASLLPNGLVLICGGGKERDGSTELYNPRTDKFTAGPYMNKHFSEHTATTLPSGKILIAGGGHECSATEIYDPATNSFSSGPAMNARRYGHFAALLPDGTVLIGGGGFDDADRSTEIYDPISNSFFTSRDLLHTRAYCAASVF